MLTRVIRPLYVFSICSLLAAACARPTPKPIVNTVEVTRIVERAEADTETVLVTASPVDTSEPTEKPTETVRPSNTPEPASTTSPTDTPRPTNTPTPVQPTATPKPTSTPGPTATSTPETHPQIVLGIPYSALNRHGCGYGGIVTRDFDRDEGSVLSWYEANPHIPKPDNISVRSKDQKWDVDYCTLVGYPVTFQQEEGVVTQARTEDGVLDIKILEGVGEGLSLSFGHVDLDLDHQTDGMQSLAKGDRINFGDIIAHTGRVGIPPDSDSATNVGIISPNHPGAPGWGVYHEHMEDMLIGRDGMPNILYDE